MLPIANDLYILFWIKLLSQALNHCRIKWNHFTTLINPCAPLPCFSIHAHYYHSIIIYFHFAACQQATKDTHNTNWRRSHLHYLNTRTLWHRQSACKFAIVWRSLLQLKCYYDSVNVLCTSYADTPSLSSIAVLHSHWAQLRASAVVTKQTINAMIIFAENERRLLLTYLRTFV